MSLRVWDEHVVPRLTDLSLRSHEVGELREVACAGLAGRVLEIGFGSGLNVSWYPPEVASVTAIESSDGGRVHALEHGRAPDESVRRWQRRLEPVQRAVAGGCHLTRDIPALVESAGWHVGDLEQAYLPGPAVARPWTYGYRLVAV
jgi:hypothetical protein